MEKKEIKNIKGKKILVLPRWYPNQLDIQLGIFIQRQLVLMREQHDFYVVYAQAIEDLPSKFQHKSNETLGFPEHVVYFRSAKGPFRKITNFSMHNTSTLQNFANNFVLFQFFAPSITNLESLPPMIFYIITLIFLNKSEIR